MLNPVQQAKSALLLRAALSRALSELAPMYADLTALASEVEESLGDESGGPMGTMVPVWKSIDRLDELIDLLEDRTDKDMAEKDPSVSVSRKELKAKATILAEQLIALSEWALKLSEISVMDDELSDAAEQTSDAAYSASLGLEDVLLSEDEDGILDKQLLSEMRRLSGITESVTKEILRQMMPVSDKYEAYLKKQLGMAFKVKLPHLTSGPNKVSVVWKTAKPKGGFMGAFVTLRVEYVAGLDLYNVEVAFMPPDPGSPDFNVHANQITRKLDGVDVEMLQNPDTMLGELMRLAQEYLKKHKDAYNTALKQNKEQAAGLKAHYAQKFAKKIEDTKKHESREDVLTQMRRMAGLPTK